METEPTKDANVCVNKPVAVDSLNGGKVDNHANGNGDNGCDSNSSLPLPRGGLSRKSSDKKTYRRVQWNDSLGNKLVQVLEYEPSDGSDSDDEDSCACSIM